MLMSTISLKEQPKKKLVRQDSKYSRFLNSVKKLKKKSLTLSKSSKL